MAITKGIVEMMNGDITVQSEKGVGTEFTVTVTLRNSECRDEEHRGNRQPGAVTVNRSDWPGGGSFLRKIVKSFTDIWDLRQSASSIGASISLAGGIT